MDKAEPGADWRNAACYAPLLDADRSVLAWEWLRRDPDYRVAARGSLSASPARPPANPAPWGLHAFEDPDLAAPAARPLWTSEFHPFVLTAEAAAPRGREDMFDLARFAPIARIVGGLGGRQHLLLSDGLRTIRVDLLAGSLSEGPVRLRYRLAGFASAEGPLLTLRRLLALARSGRFSRSLHQPEARARRWLLMLRACDAQRAGADQREMAGILLGRAANEPRWRSSAPSLRSQAQRLVRSSRRMAAGGYRELLR